MFTLHNESLGNHKMSFRFHSALRYFLDQKNLSPYNRFLLLHILINFLTHTVKPFLGGSA